MIAVDLTSLSYHLTGIERYAMCITDKLIDLDQKNRYVLIFRNEIAPVFTDRIDNDRIKAVVLHGNNKLLFLQLTLFICLLRLRADKYLFFAFPGPIAFRRKGIVNTIHDMGAWDSAKEMTALSKHYFKMSYRHAAKVSEKIITVSDFSKGRIHNILAVPMDRIIVINPGVYDEILNGKAARFDTAKEAYGLPDHYIMTLSTLEPRKNLKILLEAFNEIAAEVDYDLVLVGRKGWKMDDLLSEYEAKERIHITGFVKDEHLSAVYKNALCFVFPSLYEGFGLPPVEALALGTPVVSSDAASLPEVLLEQAMYFKNDSKEALKHILRNLRNLVDTMPCELNDQQKKLYSFVTAAAKVQAILEDEQIWQT